MHLCAWFTISGLSSKNFHVLWKAWRRCARKVISGSSGELILVERSKSGRPKLQSRFPIKRSHGEAWTEVRTAGTITFEEVGPDLTIVDAVIEYEPEGFVEKTGDVLGIASSRVEGDLKRFRDYIEQRGRETGGWRGTIEGSDEVRSSPR
jgi:hypothetical protein